MSARNWPDAHPAWCALHVDPVKFDCSCGMTALLTRALGYKKRREPSGG